MKVIPFSLMKPLSLRLSAFLLAAAGTDALRADSAWNLDAAGSWGLDTNWSPVAVPGGTGSAVSFDFDLSANRAVTLDASRTVGSLTLGDPAAPYGNYSLSTGTSGSLLVFDAAGVSEALLHFPVAASTAVNTISSAITLLDDLEVRSAGTTTAAQSLSGNITGAFRIRKTGPGVVTLLGSASSYSGGTRIEAGRLNVGRAASLGAGVVTVVEGGTLATTSTSATITNALSLSGTGCADVSTGANLGALRLANGNIISGAVTLAAPARISAYTSTGTISGVISGASPLELGWKQPANSFSTNSGGTITLSGANTHSGGTLVTNAIVKAGSAQALGTGAVTVESMTESSARGQSGLELGNGLSFSHQLTLGENAGATDAGALAVAAGNSATWSGPVTITAEPAKGGHFWTGSGGVLNLAGPLSATDKSLLQAGGTVVYSGGGAYAALKVSGTARLGAAGGIPSAATVTLGAFTPAGVLDLNNLDLTLAGLQSGLSGGTVTSANAVTLTLQNTADCAFTGTFTGPVSLVKNGPGKLTLGSSLPAGGFLVKAGTLSLPQPVLPDAGTVTLVTGTVLNLTHGQYDQVASLVLRETPDDLGSVQPEGSWGAVGSGAQHETPLITGSGYLQVGAVTDPYLLWLLANPSLATPAQQSRSADPDADGLPNILEFMLGTSPTQPTLNPLVFSSGPTALTLSFPRADAAGGQTPVPQTAPSPGGPWTDVTSGILVEDDLLGAGLDGITVTIPITSETKLFVRLKASAP